jgi:NAD(P)H-hydrate epimerase
MKHISVAQMRELERRAVEERGVPASRLMEAAGKAVADEAAKLTDGGIYYLFAGYGNNGGDGFVAARYLAKSGYAVRVFLVGEPKKLSAESQANLDLSIDAGISAKKMTSAVDIETAMKPIAAKDVIIDAIFGIGLKGEVMEFYQKVIEAINSTKAHVISVDVPSGLDADTGKPLPVAVRAEETVTFAYPKTGFKSPQAQPYLGKLIIADIGL